MVSPSPRPALYRQGALNQNASPERLDQLIQIVNPKRWLTLIALGTLVSAGTAWSLFGQIPIKVEGRGVLVYPSRVALLQTDISGRIKVVQVRAGDEVKPGDIIATIDQSELRKQLELAENQLSQLLFQNQAAEALQLQREAIERSVIQQQRQGLQARLATEKALPELVQSKALQSIAQERLEFQAQLNTLENLLPTYRERWEARAAIADSGAISRDDILNAKREYQEIEAQISQVETQLSQLDARVADVEQEYIRNQNQLLDLESQLKELDSRKATQTEQDTLAATNRSKERQEVERRVSQLKAELQESEAIRSTQAGEIIELNIQPGQLVEPGLAVATVNQVREEGQELLSINFFPVSEGQKIAVNRELQVTPGNVKREEFGGIIGRVSEVSSFPLTREGAASLVGNPEILADVIGDGSHIAVLAKLKTNDANESGFDWSSSNGPSQPIQPGITTTVRVTVEKRAPITFVLPILKQWVGLS